MDDDDDDNEGGDCDDDDSVTTAVKFICYSAIYYIEFACMDAVFFSSKIHELHSCA